MDAITNWPERRRRSRPLYNRVIDIAFEIEEGAAEPVTLDEVKDYLSIDFNDRNTELTALRIQCRGAIEKHTGLSLIRKKVNASLQNELGNIELPYGPLVDLAEQEVLAYDSNDVLVNADRYELKGIGFYDLVTPFDYIRITYEVGYTPSTIPPELKAALLEEIAYRFQNKGRIKDALSSTTRAALDEYMNQHKRMGWLI